MEILDFEQQKYLTLDPEVNRLSESFRAQLFNLQKSVTSLLKKFEEEGVPLEDARLNQMTERLKRQSIRLHVTAYTALQIAKGEESPS